MALYIKYKNERGKQFHVPFPKNLTNNSENIELIQADGDELDAIINRYKNTNIPYVHSICVWRGDLAKFIIDNLN